MPKPKLLKKKVLFIFPTSIIVEKFSKMISSAWFIFLGILKWRAKPFPEPKGIIPNRIEVLTRIWPTSLIVPSPPQATTILALLSRAFLANCNAWPLYSEIKIFTSYLSDVNLIFIKLFNFLIPFECKGFIIKNILFFLIFYITHFSWNYSIIVILKEHWPFSFKSIHWFISFMN